MTTRPTTQQSLDQSPFRFAVAATFTAEPLRPVIGFWARQLNARFDVRFAPYNQVLQTLADPVSDFGTNGHGVNIVLLRVDDFAQFGSGTFGSHTQLERNFEHITESLRGSVARMTAPLIVCLCPSSPAFAADTERAAMEQAFTARLEAIPGVHVLHAETIKNYYPVESVHDEEGDRLGRIPYTEEFYCALGTMLVRYAHALTRLPFKVIALDCDNTLWQGICGEDGPEGVVLDRPRRELHEFMLDQRSAGMLLTLASKNNEDDVIETFRVHPEMPLRLEHFVGRRLNWESKARNLADLSSQLGLGLDSFIFVDDNPKECAEVREAQPEVVSIPLPIGMEDMRHFLNHVWAFDHPVITAEDHNRSAYYQQAAEFGDEIRRATDLEAFMASLNLRVSIGPLMPSTTPRAAQLTQRTNQFNLTTIRRSEGDLQALMAAGYEIYTAHVADRFGEYGLTGVLIAKADGSRYVIDTLLLSCRVLGRGVEHRILAFAGETAASRGLRSVEVPYVRTPKNQPALDFLSSLSGGKREGDDSRFSLSLPAAQVGELTWTPAASNGTGTPVPPRAPQQHRRKVDHGRIATELSSVSDILNAMRRASRPAQADESMSETEQKVAAIWSDLLERKSIRRSDNFFDLGGHSLVAVLLLLRIRENFGVELPVDEVYSGTLTLEDLATRIEAAQLGGVNPDEYAALLAEIENMTDEEARALLAREDGPESE